MLRGFSVQLASWNVGVVVSHMLLEQTKQPSEKKAFRGFCFYVLLIFYYVWILLFRDEMMIFACRLMTDIGAAGCNHLCDKHGFVFGHFR